MDKIDYVLLFIRLATNSGSWKSSGMAVDENWTIFAQTGIFRFIPKARTGSSQTCRQHRRAAGRTVDELQLAVFACIVVIQ